MTAPAHLYAPGRHAPLAGDPWRDDRARAELAVLVDGLVGAYRGADLLWPNDPADLDDDEPDVPQRTLYLGAGGIVWALAQLARDGHAEPRLDLAALAPMLVEGWQAAPDWTHVYPAPQPSLLMGESGLLVLADQLAPAADRRERLAACIAANERNPLWDPLWASAGTMLAALALAERTGEERWKALWRASAAALLDAWRDEVWEQDLYGTRRFLVGPGHGFAGNVHALLRGRHLLEPAVADDIERRAVAVLARLAEREGPYVRWPEELRREIEPEKRRVQWCHGSPGMVIALGGLLAPEPVLDELLVGGGELTWAAGPLRASAGLCHGTAGNAYAFLRLLARTGDERWLVRARAFAMHAVAQAREERRASGHVRCPLFTGDAGVALLVAACLTGAPSFPVLDGV